MPWHLGNAMSDVIDDIDPGNALLLEQEHCLTFLLAENCDKHVGAGDFSLTGTLYMEDCTLQHALEAQRRLGFAILVMHGDQRCGGVNELLQIMLEFFEVCATRTQNSGGSLIIQ